MIDAFARRSLWEAGLDYPHGTGHGVGAALNVHEGPHVREWFLGSFILIFLSIAEKDRRFRRACMSVL